MITVCSVENFLEHKGGCVKSCPSDYEPKGAKCVECSGPCPKRKATSILHCYFAICTILFFGTNIERVNTMSV